jgi:hypothetical protein
MHSGFLRLRALKKLFLTPVPSLVNPDVILREVAKIHCAFEE